MFYGKNLNFIMIYGIGTDYKYLALETHII